MRKRLPEPLSASCFGDDLGCAKLSSRQAYADALRSPNQGRTAGTRVLPRRLPDHHVTLPGNGSFFGERIPANEQGSFRNLSRCSSMPPENRMPSSMRRLPSVPDAMTPYFPSVLSLPMPPTTLPPEPLIFDSICNSRSSTYGASLAASSPSDMLPPLPPEFKLNARMDAIQCAMSARKKYDEERRLEDLEKQQKLLIENQFLLRDLQATRWLSQDTVRAHETQDLEQRYCDALHANVTLQQDLQNVKKSLEANCAELQRTRDENEGKLRDNQRLQADLNSERTARRKLRTDLEIAEKAREEHSLAYEALREEGEHLRAKLNRELQSGEELLRRIRETEEENHRLREDLRFWKRHSNAEADFARTQSAPCDLQTRLSEVDGSANPSSRKSSKMLDESALTASKRKESLIALESVLNDLDEVSSDLDDHRLSKVRAALQHQLAELSHLQLRHAHDCESEDDSTELSRQSSTRPSLQEISVQHQKVLQDEAKQVLSRLKLVEEERDKAMQDVKILRGANDELRQGLREKMSVSVPSDAPLGSGSWRPSGQWIGQQIPEPTVEADLSMDGVSSDGGSSGRLLCLFPDYERWHDNAW